MEDFFLKAAALMEEFYWLGLMFVLVMAANAAANVVRAINAARVPEPDSTTKALPQKSDEIASLKAQLARIEKKISDRDVSV